jgi:PAS domain S-box-containing protein
MMNHNSPPPPDTAWHAAEAVLKQLAAAITATPEPDDAELAEPGRAWLSPGKQPVREFAWTEETLQSVLCSFPDGLILVDRAGVLIFTNEQAARLFGYGPRELLGEPVEILVPPRLRSRHVAFRDQFFADPHSRPMGIGLELYGRHKDGTEIPVEISLSPLKVGREVHVLSIIRDITARRKEEAKFRNLVENIPAVTFFAPLDESSPELYVSPQIEAMLGFSQEEWLADPVLWYRQLHPEDRERWNLQFAPTCAMGQPFHDVYRFLAKDGRVVWVHASAHLVRDAEGQPLFLQGVAFDISEQKRQAEQLRQAEIELRRVNAELERRVEERTRALEASLAALEEKSAELEQFAYVSSHDLRQPLRSLMNYPQKLARDYGHLLDERGLDYLRKTIHGAERMRRLIDDLLQYSRVIRRDRVFEPVRCQDIFETACINLQADIDQSQATVTGTDLPVVLGSASHMVILFQNLIGNAIKFRAPGQVPQVVVAASRQGEDWLFTVRDNGIGIEARYLERIFGLGERLHAESKYPGSGFGLAICQKIVTSHGGRMWAESELGKGSTFCLTLRDGSAALPH